jgi:hypothetical protein
VAVRERIDPAVTGNVEGNARLTASLAVVLLVTLAVEGVTLLSLRSLISVHVFVGFALIPPVALKMASTVYRFARYYTGHRGYRGKGPPPVLLRLLGPIVILTTVLLLGTGVALGTVGAGSRETLLFWHKASFVVWFAAMTVHVLGHLVDGLRLGVRDWRGPSKLGALVLRGRLARQSLIAFAIVAGIALGIWGLDSLGPWLVHA